MKVSITPWQKLVLTPSEMAFKDYKNGNDLLWKKHMGDQEKPASWRMEHYPWYYAKRRPPVYKKRRR